jgi:hypothetical protein
MKFYCNSKKRWEKTHASKLSLNEYLSWLVTETQQTNPTTQENISGGINVNQVSQTDKTKWRCDEMIMMCSKCDSRMEYAGEGLYKCLRCGNIFKNN